MSWKWSLFWLIAFFTSGGVGVAALLWLTSLPPIPDCQKLPVLVPDADRLYCAREAARSGDAAQLMAAVQVVQNWPTQHPLHQEAQRLLSHWSEGLLRAARQRIEQSDLVGAIALASAIPPSSPLYDEARQAIAEWNNQWHQGDQIVQTAREALRQQNWRKASEQLLALGQMENDYWRRQQADTLTRQILAEKTGWESLKKARKLAKDEKNKRDLAQAIALVYPIDRQTETWGQARFDLARWSGKLADAALQQWQRGDTEGAIALGRQIPASVQLPTPQQDLVRLSHATQLATADTSPWFPSLVQSWGLLEGVAAVQAIPPESPFYLRAQALLQEWQDHLQDVQQLQTASTLAALGQRPPLEWAIAQANQIAPGRPRRTQAQTLAAHWRLQLERTEDMPYLRRAMQRAAPGTIESLQAAIAAARQVPRRALWAEAEQAIATWTDQIETIEDQPILDRAQQLARQNRLRDAIRAARQIGQGRALFAQAQAAIDGWQAEITRVETAQDRRILDRAVAQANRGRLTAAIDLAAQIGRGRPLYSEARGAIAQWEAERAAAWESWSAPVEPDPAPFYTDDEYLPQ